MAAPNLKSPDTITSIIGKTQPYSCTTSHSSALSNAAGSNKVLRVSAITASNVDGAEGFEVDVSFRRAGVDTYMAKTVEVKADQALVMRSREEILYLEEGDAIFAKANVAAKIDLLITYEEII
jgi:hypothetical protein